MKKFVTYKGIAVSREMLAEIKQDIIAVEKEFECLEMPKCFSRVQRNRRSFDPITGVVLTGEIQEHYLKSFNSGGLCISGSITVVNEDGSSGTTYDSLEVFHKNWEVIE